MLLGGLAVPGSQRQIHVTRAYLRVPRGKPRTSEEKLWRTVIVFTGSRLMFLQRTAARAKNFCRLKALTTRLALESAAFALSCT